MLFTMPNRGELRRAEYNPGRMARNGKTDRRLMTQKLALEPARQGLAFFLIAM